MVDSHTPGVALPSFVVGPLGMAQGEFGRGRVWRGGTYMACTLAANRGSHKNETGPLMLRVIFLEMRKMTPKNQITLQIFRMLKFDDFIMYSSYTTKMYMKKHELFCS